MDRLSWIARVCMVGVVACGEPADGGDTGGPTTSDTDPATESSGPETSATATDTTPTACADGPACGADEFCSQGSESCDCDGQFQYCELTSTPAGCYAIPEACAALIGAEQQTCIAGATCNIGGSFSGGTLVCERYEECHGDCDFDPDSCIETSSGPSTESSSSDGGSEGGSSGEGSTG